MFAISPDQRPFVAVFVAGRPRDSRGLCKIIGVFALSLLLVWTSNWPLHAHPTGALPTGALLDLLLHIQYLSRVILESLLVNSPRRLLERLCAEVIPVVLPNFLVKLLERTSSFFLFLFLPPLLLLILLFELLPFLNRTSQNLIYTSPRAITRRWLPFVRCSMVACSFGVVDWSQHFPAAHRSLPKRLAGWAVLWVLMAVILPTQFLALRRHLSVG